MVEAGDYILVYFLADEPLGKQFQKTRHQWPLHMTLVPWFECKDITALHAALQQDAEHMSPFDLVLGGVEHFHTGATVTVVANPADEINLHEALLKTLAANQVLIRNTEYVSGGKHRAHVTHHEGQRIPQMGDVLRVGAFWLVQLLPDNVCQVAHSFELGKVQ